MNEALARHLSLRLQEPLPGRIAQSRLEPELAYGRHFDVPPPDARRAAVLALIYPGADGWRLPLVLRPPTLSSHAGQIGFPGGLVDPGETSRQAALRELQEELGVPAAQVEMLGRLSDLYLFVTNFHVIPWVAACGERPEFCPSPDEVAEMIELPLSNLLDPANLLRQRRQERGLSFAASHFQCGDRQIWGATSMILSELAAVVAEIGL